MFSFSSYILVLNILVYNQKKNGYCMCEHPQSTDLFFFFLISGDQCYMMNTSSLHGSFSPPDSNSQGVDVGVKNI